MLEALQTYGKWIREHNFSRFLGDVREGQKIAILSLSPSNLNKERVLEYEGKDPYVFYYEGGNNSVTGSRGTGGVSPFFLKKKFITKNKIEWGTKRAGTGTYTFNAIYQEIRENPEFQNYEENYILDFLNKLKGFEEEVQALDVDWVFFKEFNAQPTKDLHLAFVKSYFGRPKNKDVGSVEGKCTLCGESKDLISPNLPFLSLEKNSYNFEFKSNKMKFSKFKVCTECASDIVLGWKILRSDKLFGNKDYLFLPKLREPEAIKYLSNFQQIARGEKVPEGEKVEDLSSFEKFNHILEQAHLFENIIFDFLVLGMKQSQTVIEKLVENYKTFALRFEEEYLSKNDNLAYVDVNPEKNVKSQKRKVTSFFDLEYLLKYFFRYSGNRILPKRFHFYKLYHSDGYGLPDRIDSSFKHRLFTYRDALFSFIYQTDLNALTPNILNDICLNFLLFEIRKRREFYPENPENISYEILRGLNFYYFLSHKLWGEQQKMKEEISKLKSSLDELGEAQKEELKQVIEEDERLLYYLIGQLIRKIDNFRGSKGKNKIFSSFIQNVNPRNIKARFAKDILQGQDYYLEKLTRKDKIEFIFDLLSTKLDALLDFKPYEEMLISIITGYYSNNFL